MAISSRTAWIATAALTAAVVAIGAFSSYDSSAGRQRQRLPVVYERREKQVEEAEFYAFERAARERFLSNSPPDEIFLLASDSVSDFEWADADTAKYTDPRALITIEIERNVAFVDSATDSGRKHSRRALSGAEIKHIRAFVEEQGVDRLPRLEGDRMVDGKRRVVVDGTVFLYVHLTRKTGHRVWMNNPDEDAVSAASHDDTLKIYWKVVKLFADLQPAEAPAP